MERKHEKYQRLLDFCRALPPTPTAVAHPCDESSLRGAVDAAKERLIAPILVGPRARIEAVAKQHGLAARDPNGEVRSGGCAYSRTRAFARPYRQPMSGWLWGPAPMWRSRPQISP